MIDLPNEREKVNFKTSHAKTLEIVEKMFSDLKVKTKGTSTSATCTISRNEKESISKSISESLSSISVKKIFDDDLPEIKRFFGNSKLMPFTKNWYSKPTPLDMQFEERSFQTQFSIFANKIL